MFRASSWNRRRPAAVAGALLLAAAAAGGCSEEAILVTITSDLAIPSEASTLTVSVTAPQGGYFSQQVLGPFDLQDADIGGFPFELALLRGVVFQDEVQITVHTEDATGKLTGAGSAVTRFENGRIVRVLVNLSRVACSDDPFEDSDDATLGSALNVLEGGNQPDLTLCATDGPGADRFNFLVPAGSGLQIVLHGSDPPGVLEARLGCLLGDGTIDFGSPTILSPNRLLSVDATGEARTCVLDVTFAGPALDVQYGFLASVYDPEICVDDGLTPPVPIDVSFASTATSPPMVLCPVELDTFTITAEFDRLIEVDLDDKFQAPLSASIDCPGGAGSMGLLPIYGRTAGGDGMAATTTCTVTVFGATGPTPYTLRVTSNPLLACPPDQAEPNDVLAASANVVALGWMTPTAGGVSPPLTVCGDGAPSTPYADDWFAFALSGSHETMQIGFTYDTAIDRGDVDLEVWPPDADGPELVASRDVTWIAVASPPEGTYLLRFTCFSEVGPCGNVYRFTISVK